MKKYLHKLYKKIINFFHAKKSQEELNYLQQKIYDKSIYRIGIFSPVLLVHKVMEKVYGFESYYRLQIHGIDVNTQLDDVIVITIKLRRPGFLIGLHGKLYDQLIAELTSFFNKKIKLNLQEITDKNYRYVEFML